MHNNDNINRMINNNPIFIASLKNNLL
jgi:hypothetical protein